MLSLLRRVARTIALLAPIALVACGAPGLDGEGTSETDSALSGGDPQALAIGFNGPTDQFDYMPKFKKAEKAAAPNKVLCHTYIDWKMADQKDGGDASVQGSRAYLADYLSKAKGTCDEVLLSFKSATTSYVPSVADYTTHMKAFFDLKLAEKAGFKGDLAFTAWNEPNTGPPHGNGIGIKIPADHAARFFLALAQICTSRGCSVAAGDFASNGDMWNDFQTAANDGKNAKDTYLDTYKATIENEATSYGFKKGFKPHAFAFHGWHDVNELVYYGKTCNNYSDCLVRRLLEGMRGEWSSIPLWDTETGSGQKGAISDDEQACGAAFLVRNSTLSQRITRMYVTRLKGGDLGLFSSATQARPAMGVLAKRESSAPGHNCK